MQPREPDPGDEGLPDDAVEVVELGWRRTRLVGVAAVGASRRSSPYNPVAFDGFRDVKRNRSAADWAWPLEIAADQYRHAHSKTVGPLDDNGISICDLRSTAGASRSAMC
jgi:hypothetical protein